MQIHENGLLYRLAYCLKKPEERPKGTVNGCDVVWLVARNLVLSLIVAVAAIVMGGVIVFVLCLGVIMLYVWAVTLFDWLTHPQLPTVLHETVQLFWAIGAYVIAFMILFGVLWLIGSPAEAARLFRAWSKAKKDKVCPIWQVI